MTVTNAMGQQVNVRQAFYASPALLTPGLQTFGVQAGLVRRSWGSLSYDYGKIAGAGIYRRGMTRKLTIESSLEGTPGALMAGAGGVVQVGSLGVVNFSAAASAGTGGAGTLFSVGAQRVGRVFSVGASATVASRNFLDVAAMNGSPILRKQLSGNAGLAMRRSGSMGVAYAAINQDSSPNAIAQSTSQSPHAHVLSANYSVQIHHVSFYATEFKNLASSNSNGFQVGITIPLRRRTTVNADVTSDHTMQLQVQKSAPEVGDWGYEAYVAEGSSNHEFGQAQFKSPMGLFTAGADSSDGQMTLRMESQGAISYMDGALFKSNTIYDSFAVVDTSPMAHVRVMQENRNVGSTSASGRLLVPDMRSFDLNKITIEPTDIPVDTTINETSQAVRPQDLSGVVVKFAVKVSHAALVQLENEAGEPLPVGAIAKLQATGITVPVGYDGDAYIQDLDSHNKVEVEMPNGQRCSATFDYKAVPGDIPKIGPVRCLEQEQ
jgi:outer membrane usher protein